MRGEQDFLTCDFSAPYLSFYLTSQKIACNYWHPCEILTSVDCRSPQYDVFPARGLVTFRCQVASTAGPPTALA